jgi:GAF domain-containing protein
MKSWEKRWRFINDVGMKRRVIPSLQGRFQSGLSLRTRGTKRREIEERDLDSDDDTTLAERRELLRAPQEREPGSAVNIRVGADASLLAHSFSRVF